MNLMKTIRSQIQEAQLTPSTINTEEAIPRQVI